MYLKHLHKWNHTLLQPAFCLIVSLKNIPWTSFHISACRLTTFFSTATQHHNHLILFDEYLDYILTLLPMMQTISVFIHKSLHSCIFSQEENCRYTTCALKTPQATTKLSPKQICQYTLPPTVNKSIINQTPYFHVLYSFFPSLYSFCYGL